MAHSASDVAKWILGYNRIQMDTAGADSISNLKLQKLLYYAQGCHLAFYNKPLFDDEIVAWEHGPVVESVYHEYKNNGGCGIDIFESTVEYYNKEEDAILKTVYDNFAQYSAWGLRNMTHNERPWQETMKNAVIPIDLIKDSFEEEYMVK